MRHSLHNRDPRHTDNPLIPNDDNAPMRDLIFPRPPEEPRYKFLQAGAKYLMDLLSPPPPQLRNCAKFIGPGKPNGNVIHHPILSKISRHAQLPIDLVR